ncbi:MAG TPA: flagellar biosynthesis protein FlhA [Steroidobacteraceae bacterium]|jgi:flagellar biosynthesis protein FlhA|nr:flagellar biosynthesis protein FlhA [Steroidobacteraceae bacterium]
MMGWLRQVFAEQSELVLALMLGGVLLVLFAPIPPWLLDFLLITNFAGALLILLLTFYTARPLEFSTFPSLLLVATLFRLGLNVAATRLILSQANAGHVIAAVGRYAVGGNYVIGLIVFIVLIVVQYVVVTNGAQRVAEVAARFTLDAMPGKQMSIDADLNMGLIDQTEARERRRGVEREANFYGAMDGASRFVKGDAIAGILIILVDIIGGLAIGVAQNGMSWSESLQTYTLLTVGDGIVTQIPALVIATGTGIIVTRAASDARLGAEVSRQILGHPRTIAIVAVVLLALGLLPGIPVVPTLVLGTLMAILFWVARRHGKSAAVAQPPPPSSAADKAEDLYKTLKVDPVEIVISTTLMSLVGEEGRILADKLTGIRKQYAADMGVVLPLVRVRDERRQTSNRYEVCVFGARVAEGEVVPERLLAINPGGTRPPLEGQVALDPAYRLPAVWIEEHQRVAARAAGYTVVDALTVFMTHVAEVLKQNAHNLITRAETERLIARVREQQSSLIDELIPKVLSLGDVQRVLQGLVRERVPIRNIDAILEVLTDHGSKVKEADSLTELVRERLGRMICQQLVDSHGELQVLTFDPAVEQSLAAAVRQVDDKPTLIVEPRMAEQVLRKLSEEVERMARGNLRPVLLCAPTLRRHVRRLTERLVPQLAVLSLNEVPTQLNLRAFGTVKV